MYLSRAEPANWTELPGADHTLERHAVGLQSDHLPTAPIIDESGDATLDAVGSAAIGQHLAIEEQPTVAAIRAERGHDLLLGFHLHEITWLQVQRFWTRLALA